MNLICLHTGIASFQQMCKNNSLFVDMLQFYKGYHSNKTSREVKDFREYSEVITRF